MPMFDDILCQLDDMDAPYPAAAIQVLRDRQGEAAPVLRQMLRDVVAEPLAYHERIVQFHAAALLAEWRDAQAHELLAQTCRLDEEASEAAWCDFTTEGLPECLVATFDGDPEPLLQVVTDEAAGEWGRVAAIHALGRLACEGRCDVEAVTASLVEFAEARADSLRLAGRRLDVLLAVVAAELVPFLTLERVESELMPWFESGLATSGLVSVDRLRSRAGDRDQALRKGNDRYADIRAERLVDHLHSDQRPGSEPVHRLPIPARAPEPLAPPVAPFRRDQPKVGRNDPCPCGSGRKFKKCCGH